MDKDEERRIPLLFFTLSFFISFLMYKYLVAFTEEIASVSEEAAAGIEQTIFHPRRQATAWRKCG
nr:hypothetical protein [Cytobacillus firmus]